MQLKILTGGKKAKRITTLDFRRADFGLFRDLLGRVSWKTVLGRREF